MSKSDRTKHRSSLAAVAALGLAACQSPPVAPADKTLVGEFSGRVDPATGRLSIDALTSAEGLAPLDVRQNGQPGVGAPNTVELVTTSLYECDGPDSFGGDVTVNSFYGGAITNLVVQLTDLTPATNVDPLSTDTYPPLDPSFGLWVYGTPGTSRTWCFRILAGSGFTFRGRVWGDVSTAGLGDSAANPGSSCAAIHAARPAAPSGLYWLNPNGAPAFQTHCDMTTDGGGWTLVQRTVWDFAQSSALITGWTGFYSTNVGAPTDAFRMAGQLWPAVSPAHEVLAAFTPRRPDNSSCGTLFHKGTGATFVIDEPNRQFSWPSEVDAIQMNYALSFSTLDSGPSPFCPQAYSAVPWFYGNCCYICPTFGGGYYNPARPMAAATSMLVPDLFGNDRNSICGGSPPISSSSYDGMTAMAFYLR